MNQKTIILIVIIIAIVGAVVYLEQQKVPSATQGAPAIIAPQPSNNDRTAIVAQKEKVYERAKELQSSGGFVNVPTISLASLVGKKVILLDFWTYSCINCQRTTPYLNAWYKTYRDQGLEIIGVHTPEFEFEKVYANVANAVKNEHIVYPVVLDNNYATWQAYQNRFWPHRYLIDIDGFIIKDWIGEGAYSETEQAIQQALKDRTSALGMPDKISADMTNPSGVLNVDSNKLKSQETYFGAARNAFLANGAKGRTGAQQFSQPINIKPNELYLVGNWNIQDEFATSASTNAKIIYRYQAKHVYFVAGADNPITIQLLRDGKSLGSKIIKGHELYTLVDEPDYSEHTLEIIIPTPGLQAFTFTFG